VAGAAQAAPDARRERGAGTRERVLDAAIALLDEEGFARTTTQRSAARAGVSVGAVQHHFPAKADVLAAVLERSALNLEAQFEDVALPASATAAERAAVFVERAWRHYGSASFRSTAQILANASELAAGADGPALPIVASARSAERLWQRIFGDLDLPARRQREIRQFAFAALTGMAAASRFRGRASESRASLALLARALEAAFAPRGV